jgi:dihydroxyacetone kinase-like predicted kinase
MFFLEATDEAVSDFRRRWSELGEDVAVMGEDGLWNCHIHTDDIGAAIEAGIAAGRPRRIRVTDLRYETGELEADVAAGGFSPLLEVLDAQVGVVAVTEGRGLVERFRRLGVQQVVTPGRWGEPSGSQLLAAVEEAASERLLILPNSRTVIPVAEHVNAMTTKTVEVLPTRSILQGLAAMVAYRPEVGNLESLLDDMAAAAGAIEVGEVTQAVRDAAVDGWRVRRGDWLGTADGAVVVADPDRFNALRGLVAALLPADPQAVSLYLGDGASPSDVKGLEAWLSETHPNMVVEAAEGGQWHAPYLVAVE